MKASSKSFVRSFLFLWEPTLCLKPATATSILSLTHEYSRLHLQYFYVLVFRCSVGENCERNSMSYFKKRLLACMGLQDTAVNFSG